MEFSEKWGQDVDEAVKLALKDLNCTVDQVEIKVLEEPSKGFLGLGSKLAKVRVTMKSALTKETKEEAPAMRTETQVDSAPQKQEYKQESRPETREQRDYKGPRETREYRENRENREPREARAPRPRTETVEGQEGETPIVRTRRVSSVTRPENLVAVESHPALDFLRETTQKMGLELTITAEANDETLFLSIEGSDSGTIIGKRGQTLDAIQYLTSLVVNKEKDKYIRVVVDAENYRVKRENTLEQLADRLAGKVIKTRRTVRLEPMNPYERMVIHATLQDNPKVKTRSEGEEPYRRVIIELK
jgi:spoIIIJ-associated protein